VTNGWEFEETSWPTETRLDVKQSTLFDDPQEVADLLNRTVQSILSDTTESTVHE
jgi:hypothetical protein